MRLYGEIVHTALDQYQDKNGVDVKLHKIYLQSGDPLEGALEISVNPEIFEKAKKGDKVSFIPVFRIRSKYGTPVVACSIFDEFKVEASK